MSLAALSVCDCLLSFSNSVFFVKHSQQCSQPADKKLPCHFVLTSLRRPDELRYWYSRHVHPPSRLCVLRLLILLCLHFNRMVTYLISEKKSSPNTVFFTRSVRTNFTIQPKTCVNMTLPLFSHCSFSLPPSPHLIRRRSPVTHSSLCAGCCR